jgi:hypothetical protein
VANVRGQRYDRAREIFTDAIKRFPNNANLYFLWVMQRAQPGNTIKPSMLFEQP